MKRYGAWSVLASLFAVLAAIHPAHAIWLQNGNPVCTANDFQLMPQMTTDGAAGAIIVWNDYRTGTADIYVQRVDYAGNVLWTLNGIAVCNAENQQANYRICTDGSGGAIIAWQDQRSGNCDIYAQRVGANGEIKWGVNGISVCSVTGDQCGPAIASDGFGGTIIAWKDPRDDSDDVYAQRVDSNGVAQWAANGIPVSAGTASYPDVPQSPEIVSDGNGGALVSWSDARTGKKQLYIQKVDADGIPQWAASGVPLFTTLVSQEMHQSVSDGSGGAVIVWQMYRLEDHWTDIYAQRVTSAGSVAWGLGGVPVCAGTGAYNLRPRLIEGGDGGAFIVWEDSRSGSADVYAQRVDANGDVLWPANGIGVCTAIGHQNYPKITADCSGGAIISWQDFRDDRGNLYVQRITGSGDALWNADGVPIFESVIPQGGHSMISDGTGEAILAWHEARIVAADIFCLKIDENGNHSVGTLLLDYGASVVERCIEISWRISGLDGHPIFLIFRSSDGGPFELLPTPSIDRDGEAFRFVDASCEPGIFYQYRIEIKENATMRVLFTTDPVATTATPLILYQNYPNPFNPATVIRYYLPEAADVRLEIFDALGRRVAILVDARQDRGRHSVPWTASMDGRRLSSGLYFYRLTAGSQRLKRKMVLLQ